MQKINSLKIKKGEVVILRTDFNVPVENNKIKDSFRIDCSLESINYLLKKGAKIIVLAHIGEDGSQSLKPVYNYLNKKIPKENKLIFCTDMDFDLIAQKLSEMPNGSVRLLENIRRFEGEKTNDKNLAKNFASIADYYINDAFSVSHRQHMSIVGIPKYLPSFAGFNLLNEIKNLEKALVPKQPMLFMLGGFKFSTKLPVLNKYKKTSANYFVGGALLNNFIKAEGYNVGKSVIDNDYQIKKSELNDKKMIPVVDVVVDREGQQKIVQLSQIENNDIIADIGPATVDLLKVYVEDAKTILWNGPMGWYEKGYTRGTMELLKFIAKKSENNSNKKPFVIIGGGDTVNLVNKYKLQDKFTFVSSGGGATLEFLAKGTLVGIKALK